MGMLGIWLLCLLLPSVYHQVHGIPYDSGFTSECLATPLKAQYGGGMVVNPDFNPVVFNRNGSTNSLSHKFYFQKGMLYIISAWLRISHGNKSLITAALRLSEADNITRVGHGFARSDCWSMLKSGFTANSSGDGEIYFLSENSIADIWVDSISLQPFTEEEWRSHQIQNGEKVRKNKVRFQAVDHRGRPLAGASISVNQRSNRFPLGNAMTEEILTNTAYQNYFTSRFKLTVFGNEMKWYATESTRGTEDYSKADAMIRFAESHGMAVRGHNIFWDDPTYQMGWVKNLSPADLKTAADKRILSVMKRYKGKVIHWDVMNENLHYNFFESKLGAGVSAGYYKWAGYLDPSAIMFLNDYNTIEEPGDSTSSPAKYLQKIKEMQAGGARSLGIGLEGHFRTPDMAYIRTAIETLASANLPIWITELDVADGVPNQVNYLEQIMRELHSHPAVKGILLWGGWATKTTRKCYRMCLTDDNFKNFPTGDVVDKILREWQPQNAEIGTTDADGYLETSLFHGHYEAKITSHGAEIRSSSNSSVPPITFEVDHNIATTQSYTIIHNHMVLITHNLGLN